MVTGALGVLVLPLVAMAMFLAASDRGLNYSIHQATKESLYVPLGDAQKYKSKAFIDMFVDRAAKAGAAFALIAIIRTVGASVAASLVVSLVSTSVWAYAAYRLGAYWSHHGFRAAPAPPELPPSDPSSSAGPTRTRHARA